jgi:hypothetical protein
LVFFREGIVAELLHGLTMILGRSRAGDERARGELIALIYDELRRVAGVNVAADWPSSRSNPAFKEMSGRQSSWLRLERTNRNSPRSVRRYLPPGFSTGAVEVVRTSMA